MSRPSLIRLHSLSWSCYPTSTRWVQRCVSFCWIFSWLSLNDGLSPPAVLSNDLLTTSGGELARNMRRWLEGESRDERQEEYEVMGRAEGDGRGRERILGHSEKRMLPFVCPVAKLISLAMPQQPIRMLCSGHKHTPLPISCSLHLKLWVGLWSVYQVLSAFTPLLDETLGGGYLFVVTYPSIILSALCLQCTMHSHTHVLGQLSLQSTSTCPFL